MFPRDDFLRPISTVDDRRRQYLRFILPRATDGVAIPPDLPYAGECWCTEKSLYYGLNNIFPELLVLGASNARELLG